MAGGEGRADAEFAYICETGIAPESFNQTVFNKFLETMKKTLLVMTAAVLAMACGDKNRTAEVVVLTDGISYPESVALNDTVLYVANFGSSRLDPLNDEGKGYILAFAGADTVSRMLVPPSGILSAPKGMQVKNDNLYVADVNKLVIYDLENLDVAPGIINLPQGENYVNDLAFNGDDLYITVTNSGNIYMMDVEDPDDSLKVVANVPGANGIAFKGNTAYVASYPPDGNTSADNVIYVIEDVANPIPVKLSDRQGHYDGLAVAEDDNLLYFTNWVDGEVGCIDLSNNEVSMVDLGGVKLGGPARLIEADGVLYIPDLPNNRVVKVRPHVDRNRNR